MPAPSTSLGLTSVVAKFSETGDFTTPDFTITASGSPSLNDGVFYNSLFFNIPSTTWGQSSNGNPNVQVLVSTIGGGIGETPIIQYQLLSEPQ